jgi:phosphate transport system ATP-binding protein
VNINATTILQIKSYCLAFGEQKILNNINLNLSVNKITALVGPSGCGKSSLLLSIINLLSAKVKIDQTGDIKYKNINLAQQRPLEAYRKGIGLVFQKPQPFPMSIKENILLPIKEHLGLSKTDQNQKIEEVLMRAGLWHEVKDRLNQSALSLSGGQQQRLCIARSLVLNPEVLLMDEPCSSLDPLSTEIIENLITQLKSNCTILLVTHNLAQASRVADETGVMWTHPTGGELIEFGPTQEIFYKPKNEITKLYLSGKRG